MTDSEFRDWLLAEEQAGRMSAQQRLDLLRQKQLFDGDRTQIEQSHPHQVVGYVDGRREVGPTVQQLLAKVRRSYPGRMVYFEPVGFKLF